MTSTDFNNDRAYLLQLIDDGKHGEAQRFVAAMHVTYHDRPREHVGVHLAWMRLHASQRAYARAVGHAFLGYVLAVPVSLVQRYTGLVNPAFNAERRS
jgi:hypothetical protein